jgi:hypothetical protein
MISLLKIFDTDTNNWDQTHLSRDSVRIMSAAYISGILCLQNKLFLLFSFSCATKHLFVTKLSPFSHNHVF